MGGQGSVAPLVGHYFDADPAIPSERRSVPLVLPDLVVDLTTDTGVFGRDAVDPGTRLLLVDGPPVPARGDLLDLGCGYGPVTVALATRAPDATVWAVDVNRRAVALTAANAEAAGCTNVRAMAPDEVPDDVRFAAIWSNPPIRIGKAALHALLLRWLARLAPGGRAVLVVHKHLGADSLAGWLGGAGHPVERLGSRMGYRLLAVAAAPPLPVTPGGRPPDRSEPTGSEPGTVGPDGAVWPDGAVPSSAVEPGTVEVGTVEPSEAVPDDSGALSDVDLRTEDESRSEPTTVEPGPAGDGR